MGVEKHSSEELPTTYEYARFGILLQTMVMLPIYVLWIWDIVTTDEVTLRHVFFVLALVFFSAINLRALIRLRERITVSSDGVTKKTALSQTHISWSSVARVKPYFSWLEWSCYRVESVDGAYITVSQMLRGYEELYGKLKRRVPASVAK